MEESADEHEADLEQLTSLQKLKQQQALKNKMRQQAKEAQDQIGSIVSIEDVNDSTVNIELDSAEQSLIDSHMRNKVQNNLLKRLKLRVASQKKVPSDDGGVELAHKIQIEGQRKKFIPQVASQ